MFVWTLPNATEGGIFRLRYGRSQDHEFIAALTTDDIEAPHGGDQRPGNRKQHLVTDYVTLGIIDVFEAFHIDK